MRIIWFQPKTPASSEADTIILNGVHLENTNLKYDESFDILFEQMKRNSRKHPPFLRYNKNTLFIKGLFDCKDDAGRILLFIYYSTRNTDYNEAYRNLSSDLDVAGYNLSAETKTLLDKKLKGQNNKSTLIYVSIIIILIFTTICIWKIRN